MFAFFSYCFSYVHTPNAHTPEEPQKGGRRKRTKLVGGKNRTLPGHQCPQLRVVGCIGWLQMDEKLQFYTRLKWTFWSKISSQSREEKYTGHLQRQRFERNKAVPNCIPTISLIQ